MEDTEEYDAIVTVLNDDHGHLDCTAPSFLGPYGGLVLQVARLCQDRIILSNSLRSAPIRGGCFGDPGDTTTLRSGVDTAGTLACVTSAIFNDDLTTTLPRLLAVVSPTQTESMDNLQCVRRVPTNLSAFPVTNLGARREAVYEATLALSSGNPAALEPRRDSTTRKRFGTLKRENFWTLWCTKLVWFICVIVSENRTCAGMETFETWVPYRRAFCPKKYLPRVYSTHLSRLIRSPTTTIISRTNGMKHPILVQC